VITVLPPQPARVSLAEHCNRPPRSWATIRWNYLNSWLHCGVKSTERRELRDSLCTPKALARSGKGGAEQCILGDLWNLAKNGFASLPEVQF
jgi:hypothetical protein